MATLVFDHPQDLKPKEFSDDLRLGTREENDLKLAPELAIAPHHALITRSKYYKVPVLLDLAGGSWITRVNDRKVIRLKTLRHRDQITLGEVRFTFWEIMIQRVAENSKLIEKRCLVCYSNLNSGDLAVCCPRCDSPHHKECWFLLSTCAYYGCGYTVRNAICRVLAPWVRFEQVDQAGELIKKNLTCPAGRPRDRQPFKRGESLAFCPECDTPFHVACWLLLPECPKCHHDISTLVNSVFSPGSIAQPKEMIF